MNVSIARRISPSIESRELADRNADGQPGEAPARPGVAFSDDCVPLSSNWCASVRRAAVMQGSSDLADNPALLLSQGTLGVDGEDLTWFVLCGRRRPLIVREADVCLAATIRRDRKGLRRQLRSITDRNTRRQIVTDIRIAGRLLHILDALRDAPDAAVFLEAAIEFGTVDVDELGITLRFATDGVS